MEAERIFSQSLPCFSTEWANVTGRVNGVDLGIGTTFVPRAEMPPQLPAMTAPNVDMGSGTFIHIGQLEEVRDRTVAVNIVMEGLTAFSLLIERGVIGKTPPHAGTDQGRFTTQVATSQC